MRVEGRPQKSFNVLLAEDDPALRAMLSMVLRNDSHRVTEFSNGADLEAYLESFPPELVDDNRPLFVVADFRMPDRDGLAVMRGLSERGYQPPFILMTAFGDRHTHAAAHALGAVAVLDKPFDFDELRHQLRSFATR